MSAVLAEVRAVRGPENQKVKLQDGAFSHKDLMIMLFYPYQFLQGRTPNDLMVRVADLTDYAGIVDPESKSVKNETAKTPPKKWLPVALALRNSVSVSSTMKNRNKSSWT